MKFTGKAFTYGDDVNTDVIFPGKYLKVWEPAEMAKHAMEDIDKDFVKNVKAGDVVVAGKYFGCGSSREQAATCLKAAGISAVVAESFARIFYRNAINQGLTILVCPGISKMFSYGDQIEIDPLAGIVKNITKGGETKAKPLPPFIMGILQDGGLIPHLQKKMKK